MAYIGKSPSGLGVRTRYYYTATGGETSLSGADDNGRVLKFTDGEYIDVYLNGVLLVAGTDYGTGTANTISSLDALSAGNIVEIVAYDIHSLAKPNLEALRKRYYKTATGGETSISGNDDNGAAITFAANAEIEVYLNGVALVQGDDYNTTTANTVGGLAALDADDIVSIVAYEEFTLGDVVSKKSGGTFAGDVTFSQDISVGVNATITGDLAVDTDTLYVDSTNNRVGINAGSPSANLTVTNGASGGTLSIGDNAAGSTAVRYLQFGESSDYSIQSNANSYMRFYTEGTERMRIDSSGNLLVGKTSSDFGVTAGFEFYNTNIQYFTRDSGTPLILNRLSSDGGIALFRKDGTTVGSINSRSGVVLSVVFNPLSNGSGLTGGTYAIMPADQNGNKDDNIIDLGSTSSRFDDVYATNGTIQTSDQNEKQQIASLTTAEITAAKAISKLFKTFKWNDKVEAKGDAARTHTGVIAQDVQQAMTDAGLNADDYAFFISSTWWESGGEIYDTQADAPEGATERTRLGIRYPELLAFVGAATEQRLADIETRIAALEAN